jgi:translocation and assembly module TamB
MSMDARVTGTTAKPVLSGEARVVRGDYDFAGKRFEFDNRGTVRLSSDLNQVRLDLTASWSEPSLTAMIRIQGTAAKPQIVLSSVTVLPNDEVLAQVLFGSSAAQLSPLQAAQLASALSALASGGIPRPMTLPPPTRPGKSTAEPPRKYCTGSSGFPDV